ncbi:MAG: hypothetical protein HOD92_10915 [Deltaproteobacteria bacterium]|jgi:nitrogen regulatory protein P-II 1|nr:hypothetical protein [Deltaproteobacteria bacterium]
MKLAVIFLNRIEYLEELLSIFLEIGVSGATVLDSMGMGHIISENIPIFAGLREAFVGSSPSRKIILVITEDDMIERMYHALDEVCNSESDKETSFIISLPIDKIYGLNI